MTCPKDTFTDVQAFDLCTQGYRLNFDAISKYWVADYKKVVRGTETRLYPDPMHLYHYFNPRISIPDVGEFAIHPNT